jgi:hypothetical protein
MRAQIWLTGSSIYFGEVIFPLLSLAGSPFNFMYFRGRVQLSNFRFLPSLIFESFRYGI